MIVDDQDIKVFVKKKQEMIKNEASKIEIDKIDTQIREMTKSIIERENENFKKIEEIKKMEEKKIEEKVEQMKEKPGKKVQANSNTMLIVKALKMKSLNNMDKVAKKVVEWKPECIEKKLQSQIKSIIKFVKTKKSDRWKKYTWDEEQYFLTEKTE